MLRYMKTAVKMAGFDAESALKRRYNERCVCNVILYMTFTFAFNGGLGSFISQEVSHKMDNLS